MFYSDILTREKIKAGKFILDRLVEEGWEVHGAAWLLHGELPDEAEWYPGYEIHKDWRLHFFVRHDTREAMMCADHRISELRNAYIGELYGNPLFEDYFHTRVDSPDDRLAQRIINRIPQKLAHPLGQRLSIISNGICDGFVYNLIKPSTRKDDGQDLPPD